MLKKLRADQHPDLIAVVMDAPGRTFRDELFADYKANRPAMPDELGAQIEPLQEVVRALGLPLLCETGVEADDVIGTLAKRAVEAGLDTVIATSDKDMAQIVGDRITLVDTLSGRVLDPAGVRENSGCRPNASSTTSRWSATPPTTFRESPASARRRRRNGSMNTATWRPSSARGRDRRKDRQKLRANLDTLDLSRQLATIDCGVSLGVAPEELVAGEPDPEALRALYQRLGDQEPVALCGRPGRGPEPGYRQHGHCHCHCRNAAQTPVERRYETLLTGADFERWLGKLHEAKLVAFDTETTSLDYMSAPLVGLSVALTPGEAAYLPVGHSYMGAPDQLDLETVLTRLKPWLEDPERAKVGHHLKYDAHVLANHGVRLAGIRYDTMLESYVLNSVATRHALASVAKLYLGVDTIRYEDVAGKGASQIGFEQVAIDKATAYAAEDADVTLRLHETLWPRLGETGRLASVYDDIERPLVAVLTRMEETGVLVDTKLLKKLSSGFAEKMAAIEKEAHAAAGHPFNLTSPKQLQEVLFNELKLPVTQYTPTKQPSTNEEALEELAEQHPLPRLILDYRSLSKLKSTYTDKLPAQVNPGTGRIHTSYHQAVAATGRLSSTDPNLQNIPIRTVEGRRIRQAFIARPGHVLLAADYSQIELRIMAHLSGDEGLLKAFAADQDIHQATAAEVFGLPLDQVTADQRRSAKAINFGLIYGMSAFGLARQLGIGRDEAQTYVNLYFARYPGVKAYMDRTRAEARELGYVETVFGRRLYLPEIRHGSRPAASTRNAARSMLRCRVRPPTSSSSR